MRSPSPGPPGYTGGRLLAALLRARGHGSRRSYGPSSTTAEPRASGARAGGRRPARRAGARPPRGGRGGGGPRGRGLPHRGPSRLLLPRGQRGGHRAPAGGGGARGRAALRAHLDRGRARRRRSTRPPTRRRPSLPGDIYQATKAEAEALALRFHRERGLARGGGAAGRDLRSRRDAPPEAVPRDRARALRGRGLGPHVLPPRLHRRPRGRVPARPRAAGGGGRGVHHRGPALRRRRTSSRR